MKTNRLLLAALATAITSPPMTNELGGKERPYYRYFTSLGIRFKWDINENPFSKP